MASVIKNMLKSFSEGTDDFAEKYNAQTTRIMGMLDEIYKKGCLDTKTKELIGIAIAVYTASDYNIVYHVYRAFEADASVDEIMEAGFVAVAFGGERTMSYMMTLLKDCVEEFEKDFKNKK